MKWTMLLKMSAVLLAGQTILAQDAATQERLDKLSGQIDSCTESQQALNRKLDALSRELENLREQMGKKSGNYASDEDVKHLAEVVRDIDQKRMADYEKLRVELKSELQKLAKVISSPPPATRPRHTTSTSGPDAGGDGGTVPSEGFDYEVRKNDTLSLIVQAYREKNINVTVDQILKANPGLDPNKLKVGKKIFIPKPQS